MNWAKAIMVAGAATVLAGAGCIWSGNLTAPTAIKPCAS